MDLSPQLCVAESSTKVPTLPPVRRLDLGRNLSFSLLPYFFNGLLAVTPGIGLQNLPEGLAVAAALIGDGSSRLRAFVIATPTGLVEPIGGLVGATMVGMSETLLPWGLSSAAGAMLFVISGEIIPETHREGREHAATFTLVGGFVLMMLLDVALGGRLGSIGARIVIYAHRCRPVSNVSG